MASEALQLTRSWWCRIFRHPVDPIYTREADGQASCECRRCLRRWIFGREIPRARPVKKRPRPVRKPKPLKMVIGGGGRFQ